MLVYGAIESIVVLVNMHASHHGPRAQCNCSGCPSSVPGVWPGDNATVATVPRALGKGGFNFSMFDTPPPQVVPSGEGGG